MQYLAPDYVCGPQGLLANIMVSISDDGHIVSIKERDIDTQSIPPSDISILP